MRRRNRIDTVQPVLVARLKALGADWLPWPGGTIDGLVCFKGRVYAIDFKSGPKAKMKPSQVKLVKRGWPIWFPRSEADIDQILGIARRVAP